MVCLASYCITILLNPQTRSNVFTRMLESIYLRLLKMDEAAKTSAMPLDMALEMFVVELAGKN